MAIPAIMTIVPLIKKLAKAIPPDKYPYLWGVGGYVYKIIKEKTNASDEDIVKAMKEAGVSVQEVKQEAPKKKAKEITDIISQI